MKKRFTSALLLLSLIGFSAQAQTETVAPEAKKLQQLYLSVGYGPAFTANDNIKSIGTSFSAEITSAFNCNLVLRSGVKITGFTFSDASGTDLEGIGNVHDLHTFTLSAGKSKNISKLIQLQALGGVSYNLYYKPIYPKLEDYEGLPEVNSRLQPAKLGAIIQTEAMFLPTRFAGLTIGGFYHFVPKISNGGLTLSLNLGMLK